MNRHAPIARYRIHRSHGGGQGESIYTDDRATAVEAAKEAGVVVEDMGMRTPYIYGPVADSWCIARGIRPKVEWLTPEREWQGSIFEAARFELDEREKAER
jgi:hypothetical protein